MINIYILLLLFFSFCYSSSSLVIVRNGKAKVCNETSINGLKVTQVRLNTFSEVASRIKDINGDNQKLKFVRSVGGIQQVFSQFRRFSRTLNKPSAAADLAHILESSECERGRHDVEFWSVTSYVSPVTTWLGCCLPRESSV